MRNGRLKYPYAVGIPLNFGEAGETRTLTEKILSLLPRPIGLQPRLNFSHPIQL